jgi:hypothetical protein
MPYHDETHVEDVESNHNARFPQREFPVPDKDHTKGRGNDEEAHVPDEASSRNFEWSHQGHGACYDGSDEARRSYQFADCETSGIGVEGGKRGEDIRTSIAER